MHIFALRKTKTKRKEKKKRAKVLEETLKNRSKSPQKLPLFGLSLCLHLLQNLCKFQQNEYIDLQHCHHCQIRKRKEITEREREEVLITEIECMDSPKRKDGSVLSLREWEVKSQSQSQKTKPRRHSASYIRTFHHQTHSFSAASSPAYPFKGMYICIYMFKQAFKDLHGFDLLSSCPQRLSL